MSARWVEWLESLHGHESLCTRASGMLTPCQSRIAQANISPLRWHIRYCSEQYRIWGKVGRSSAIWAHSRGFSFSPEKHFIHTFTRWVSESIQSGVSHWMRRSVFPCQRGVCVAASSRGFDTWRAQTRLDARLEGARRDLDWRESVRYAFAHRGKQTSRQPIAFSCKPQSIILNGA